MAKALRAVSSAGKQTVRLRQVVDLSGNVRESMGTLQRFVRDLTNVDERAIRAAVVKALRDPEFGAKARVIQQINARFKDSRLKADLIKNLSVRVHQNGKLYISSRHPAAGFFEYGRNMRNNSAYVVPVTKKVLAVPIEAMGQLTLGAVRSQVASRLAEAGVSERDWESLRRQGESAALDYRASIQSFRRAQQMLSFARLRRKTWEALPDVLRPKRQSTRERKQTARDHAVELAESYLDSARTRLFQARKEYKDIVKELRLSKRKRKKLSKYRGPTISVNKKDGRTYFLMARAKIARGRQNIIPVLDQYGAEGMVAFVNGKVTRFSFNLKHFEVSYGFGRREWREE